jgi:glycosyltransferase involved in cell wall biosynthesis
VVISPQQRHEIHEVFGVGRANQFAVIRLGLDLEMFRDWPCRRLVLRRELRAAPDEVLVGIVGRLTEIKNHQLFLQMVVRYKALSTISPRVRFVVIGNGHLRASLESASKDLGLDQDVQFLGHRDDPENFYPGLDVVTLTSRNEGTPLSLIEAMANGRPVLATSVGGVVDLVGPAQQEARAEEPFRICAHGITSPSGDSVALALGLRRLVVDENFRRRIGAQGQAFVQDHYARSRLLTDIAALYQELLTPARLTARRKEEESAPYSEDACVGG